MSETDDSEQSRASDSDSSSLSTDDGLDDYWEDELDGDDFPFVLALLGIRLRAPGPWHNGPNRPQSLDAAKARFGDHLEHFTRFDADQLDTLVGLLAIPEYFKVKG